jgi:hypothetical protein
MTSLKKVMYIECSIPYWLDIADRLKKEQNWQPVYWTTGSKYIKPEEVHSRFPNVLYHENYDAVRGIPHPHFTNKELACADPELIKSLAYNESILLKMMDRMDPFRVFIHNDRIRLYHQYIRYWTTVLDQMKPDMIITPVSPHLMYDYVLYILAKKRNIPVMMFVETVIPGYLYPITDFENPSEAICRKFDEIVGDYNNSDSIDLSSDFNTYLNKVKSSYEEAIPYYMVDQYKRKEEIASKGFLKKILNLRKYPDYIINKLQPPPIQFYNYFKSRGFDIEDRTLDESECREYYAYQKRVTAEAVAYYGSLAKPADYSVSYIYFPLSYQPEKTTSPDGDIFVNQFLCVEMIAKNLPPGWKVYVKEHPTQFMYEAQIRYLNLYKDILSLPNVELIALGENTFQLIDNSKGVGVVTGSAGWEAVLRSKPCFVFGYTWYHGCEGTFYTSTIQSVKEVIDKIYAGYKPEALKVKVFMKAIEETCIKANIDPYSYYVDPAKTINELYNALVNLYNSSVLHTSK